MVLSRRTHSPSYGRIFPHRSLQAYKVAGLVPESESLTERVWTMCENVCGELIPKTITDQLNEMSNDVIDLKLTLSALAGAPPIAAAAPPPAAPLFPAAAAAPPPVDPVFPAAPIEDADEEEEDEVMEGDDEEEEEE